MITKSEKETFELGQKLARRLRGGEVIALIGSLGAGKTIFIKGLAKGLGIKKTITSPTFVLMKICPVRDKPLQAATAMPKAERISNGIYPVRQKKVKSLCHIDAYRLTNGQELIDIGVNDWLGKKDVVTVIEWADRVKEILPKKKIKIKIDFAKKEKTRRLEVVSYKL